MPETSKNKWEKGNLEQIERESAELMAELNRINQKLNLPEEKLVQLARDKELEKGRGNEILKNISKEIDRAQETEKNRTKAKNRIFGDEMHEILTDEEYDLQAARAADVQKIMADEDAAKAEEPVEQEELVEQEEPIEQEEEQEELTDETIETSALEEELAEINKKIAELKTPNSLVAVGVDWEESEEKLAKKLARKDLEKELEESGFIKRIWKGNIFRNFYEDIYMYDYLDGDRTDEEGRTLSEIIDNQKQEYMDEIVSDVTEQVHEYNQEEWDKKLVPVDKETNEKLKSTVEDYARFMYEISELRPDMAEDPEFVEEVDVRFNKHMAKLIKQAQKDGKITGNVETNNYLNVAKEAADRYKEAVKNAKDKVEQDAAMANVMAGFQAYNIMTRKRFSHEHSDRVDKIINKLGSDKVGQFVPVEDFSNAVDEINDEIKEAEDSETSGDVKTGRELLGGDAGVEVMLDQSPITPQSVMRWNQWWNGLSDEGRRYAQAIIKQVNDNPDLYDLKWGDGFRTWLTVINAQELAAA